MFSNGFEGYFGYFTLALFLQWIAHKFVSIYIFWYKTLYILCLYPGLDVLVVMKWVHLRAIFTHEAEILWPLHFKHSHWWKRVEPVQVRFTLRSRDQRSMWMQDGCKVYMDSYMASNGSCFMVTWIIFKNHLLEVGRPRHFECSQLSISSILSCSRTRMIRNTSK